jgi:hypothetical protein
MGGFGQTFAWIIALAVVALIASIVFGSTGKRK